jgi:hypothetical protein
MHNTGRFGAMTIVVINGDIEYISFNASTLPDNPKGMYSDGRGHATVMPGVYYIKPDYAGANQSDRSGY